MNSFLKKRIFVLVFHMQDWFKESCLLMLVFKTIGIKEKDERCPGLGYPCGLGTCYPFWHAFVKILLKWNLWSFSFEAIYPHVMLSFMLFDKTMNLVAKLWLI